MKRSTISLSAIAGRPEKGINPPLLAAPLLVLRLTAKARCCYIVV